MTYNEFIDSLIENDKEFEKMLNDDLKVVDEYIKTGKLPDDILSMEFEDDEELDEDIDDKEKKYSISGKDTSAQDFYKTVSNDNLSDDEINKIENGEEVKRGGKSYSIKNEDLEVADITEESVPPMPEGTDSTISNMLIELINGEWNTIADYNNFVNACKQSGNTDLVSIIEDITNEEANHVGMLQTALKTLSPNTETIEDGQEEAEKDLQDS